MTSDPAANEHDEHDLGPAILERTLGRIVSEPSRVVRDRDGLTWWDERLRQRMWTTGPYGNPGGPAVWQLQARTPVFRDVADDEATYRLLGRLNRDAAMWGYVYDPADGTVTCRTVANAFGRSAVWVEGLDRKSTRLNSSH